MFTTLKNGDGKLMVPIKKTNQNLIINIVLNFKNMLTYFTDYTDVNNFLQRISFFKMIKKYINFTNKVFNDNISFSNEQVGKWFLRRHVIGSIFSLKLIIRLNTVLSSITKSKKYCNDILNLF